MHVLYSMSSENYHTQLTLGIHVVFERAPTCNVQVVLVPMGTCSKTITSEPGKQLDIIH